MDKNGLLEQWLNEYDELAEAHAEAFDIGRGANKAQSDAYWLGSGFGRDFFKGQVVRLIAML
jgi:hypothetical protein